MSIGFGMNAYFEKLKYFTILMLLMFIFSLPAISVFKSYSGLTKQPMGMITKYSLGNMGESRCKR